MMALKWGQATARTEGHFQPVFFTHLESEFKESKYNSVRTCTPEHEEGMANK